LAYGRQLAVNHGGAPNSTLVDVTYGDRITLPSTVFTISDVTAKSLRFDNANTYAVCSATTITLASYTGASTISVELGAHVIQTGLKLRNAATITAAAGRLLYRLDVGTSNATLTVIPESASSLLALLALCAWPTCASRLKRATVPQD
jgi:hypothetical protein